MIMNKLKIWEHSCQTCLVLMTYNTKKKYCIFSDKDKGKDECKYHSGIITKLKYYTGTIPDNNLEILKTVIEKGMFEEIKIITSVLDTLHANPSKRYKQYQENCIIGLMHCDKEDKEDRDLETFPNMFTITGWKHESSN